MFGIFLTPRGRILGTLGASIYPRLITGLALRDLIEPHEWRELEPFFLAAIEGKSGSFIGRDRDGAALLWAAQPVYGQHRFPRCVLLLAAPVPEKVLADSLRVGIAIDPAGEV